MWDETRDLAPILDNYQQKEFTGPGCVFFGVMSSKSSRRKVRRSSKLSACGVWKGENETDPELMEGAAHHPLT